MMFGLTCPLLSNTGGTETSPPPCRGGNKSGASAEDAQPRHGCCSKPWTDGRSLDFGRTKGTGQATEELHPSSAAFGCSRKIMGNIFVRGAAPVKERVGLPILKHKTWMCTRVSKISIDPLK